MGGWVGRRTTAVGAGPGAALSLLLVGLLLLLVGVYMWVGGWVGGWVGQRKTRRFECATVS